MSFLEQVGLLILEVHQLLRVLKGQKLVLLIVRLI